MTRKFNHESDMKAVEDVVGVKKTLGF